VRLLEQSDERSVVELVVVEGRKHQIRAMMEAVGHPVRRLLRVRFGPLTLQGLSPGESRPLLRPERAALLRMLEEPGRQARRASAAPRAQKNQSKIE
jgi:23S rRNA pseudouridine2605 synthase